MSHAPAARSIDYVVLDPALQQADPSRFGALFTEFTEGYERHFSGDEAEPTGEWQARIAGKPAPQPIMRIVVAVDREDRGERVIGGLAVEYYRTAGCVLATYLYVSDDEPYRHRGHARALLLEADQACRALGPVRAVLAEAEWPEALRLRAAPLAEVAVARARMRFFARLGARLFNLDYVQPVLGAGKRAVSYLRLFLLPAPDGAARLPDEPLSVAVGAFLNEFYAALGEGPAAPADQATLAELHWQLARRRPLTLPLPRLRLEDVAVCFHFVEPLGDSPESTALLDEVRDGTVCPVFHSMETDLLSRAYRTRRLFRTVCFTKPESPAGEAGIAVEIDFPRRIVFRSEHRHEERQWPLRRRRVRAYLAPSFFFDARLIIWHLTLKADARAAVAGADAWLDELDVITLCRLTDDAADQEFLRAPGGDRIMQGVEFRLADGDGAALDLKGLLVAVGAIARERLGDVPTPHEPSPPRAATVEVLGRDMAGDQPFFGITDRLEREALCGIVTGIFDFDAIDDAEAGDTLTSSVALDDALLRAHREVLIYVRRDDRAARTVAGSVGISPYLIRPHAAVLCDEWLLEQFESPMIPRRGAREVAALAGEVQRLEDTLRTKWVPNPFFYPTEQALYERVLVEGGTGARRAKAEERLLELKTRLQLAREAERTRFEAIVAGLLGAISVVSLDPLVVDVVSWLRGPDGPPAPADGKLLGHWLTLGVACAIGLVVFLWKRPTADAGER